MGHYAFLDENNVVIEVITGRDENEVVDGISDWEAHYSEFRGKPCKRTSYNTIGGVHSEGKEPFRYNYAGIGFTFDPTIGTDGAFIPPKPYPSWVLDETICSWKAPIDFPSDAEPDTLKWDETSQQWISR